MPDVAVLFMQKAKLLESGITTVDTTARIGSTDLTIHTETRSSHGDSEVTTTTTTGGTSTTTHTITIDDKTYEQIDAGPWLPKEEEPSDEPSFGLEDLAAGAFVDQGVEMRGGKPVHRLVLESDDFDVADLVLTGIKGATGADGDVIFFAAEDGTPVAASVVVTWKQPQGDATVDATMSIEMEFRNLGGSIMVKRPEHVWQRFSSTRYGFAFAYPDEWSYVQNGSWEEFDAPWSAVMLIQAVGTQGASLNVEAKTELAALKKEFGTKSGTNDATKLDGVPARLLAVSGWSESIGAKVNVFEVVAVNSFHVWYVAWLSEVGRETIDRQTFDQVLSTFEFELIRMQ